MAHSTLHFSLGWILGSLVFFVSSLRIWLNGRASDWFKKWFIWSFAFGVFAVVPGIFLSLRLPNGFCAGWWMNVFVLHPLLDELKPGGITMGPLLLGACLGGQYMLIVVALWYAKRKK